MKGLLLLVAIVAMVFAIACSNGVTKPDERLPVAPPTGGLGLDEFEIRIIRGYVEARHDKVVPIKSIKEFEKHPTLHLNEYYCFEREMWVTDDLRQIYTSEFFENHYLVSFGLITSNEGVRFEITHIDKNGVIFITQSSDIGGFVMGEIGFLLEVPNSFDREQFSIQVINQHENYCLVIGCQCEFTEPPVEPPPTGLSLSEFKVHKRVEFLGESGLLPYNKRYDTILIRNPTELERHTEGRSGIMQDKFCEEMQAWYFVDIKPNYPSEFFEDRYLLSIIFTTPQFGPDPEIVGIDADGNINFTTFHLRDAMGVWSYLLELPKTFSPKSFSVQLSEVSDVNDL